jgi:hypothetical protein
MSKWMRLARVMLFQRRVELQLQPSLRLYELEYRRYSWVQLEQAHPYAPACYPAAQ